MKALKFIGIGLLAVIAVLLIVALFVPKDFTYEKSITIYAPIDSVWEHTNSLAALDKWSPWNDHDPNMKKEMSGIDGTIGAKQSWVSDVEGVGTGNQVIKNIEKPTLFETELNFLKPHESQGNAYVKLRTVGTATNVTWGMTGKMPYPFNIMNLFMNMEKSMGKDWNNGLMKLKKLSEK
ncbi:MAG: SRPBCC family protein [Paludibacter sp.]|jgi:hypothetical protein|nr:SRPBCC family protein [Paludibacter sp.]